MRIAAASFTGRERDDESILDYHRARYYVTTIGVWASADPISFAAGDENLYRYVGNSPTNYTDPSGLVVVNGDRPNASPNSQKPPLPGPQPPKPKAPGHSVVPPLIDNPGAGLDGLDRARRVREKSTELREVNVQIGLLREQVRQMRAIFMEECLIRMYEEEITKLEERREQIIEAELARTFIGPMPQPSFGFQLLGPGGLVWETINAAGGYGLGKSTGGRSSHASAAGRGGGRGGVGRGLTGHAVDGPEVTRRPGTRGHEDHQRDVRGGGRRQAEAQAGPGETVVSEQPITGHPGVNRRADNQVRDQNGRTRVVVESERRPNGAYHKKRKTELEGRGIDVQTRPPETWED